MENDSLSLKERHRRVVTRIPSLEPYKDAQQVIVLMSQFGAKKEEFEKALRDEGVTDFWIPLPQRFAMFILEARPQFYWSQVEDGLLSTTFDFDPSPELNSVPVHYSLSSASCDKRGHPKTLNVGMTLGTTKSAAVNKVTLKGRDDIVLALKKIPRKFGLDEESGQMRRILGEIRALRKVRHRHYIRIIASYTTETHVGIIMSPVADCDLEKYLDNFWLGTTRKTLHDKQDQLARFFGCLAQAVANLHCTYGIRHRDIKPKNILVRGQQILLTDFGIALDWSGTGDSTTQSTDGMRDPAYCAPEVYHGEKKGTKSDVWSLGCVFLEMALVLERLPRDYIKSTITNGFYWKGINATQSKIEVLRRRESRWKHEPLGWVQNMIKEDRNSRWKAADVVRAILASKLNCFSEYCCHTWEEPASLDVEELQGYKDEQKEEQSAWIYDQFGTHVKVVMLEDPQYSSNWISSTIVDQYEMEAWDTEDSATAEVDGNTVHSNRRTRIVWRKTDGPTREEEFFVSQLPSSLEMIVTIDP